MHPAIRLLLIILLLTVVVAEPGDRMQCGPKFPPPGIARSLFPRGGYSLEDVSLKCITLCTCLHYAPDQFEVYCDHNSWINQPLVEYCRENCRCSPHLLTGPVETGPGDEGEGQNWGMNTRRRTRQGTTEVNSKLYQIAYLDEEEVRDITLGIVREDSCESSTSPSRRTRCSIPKRLPCRIFGIDSTAACEAKERMRLNMVILLYEESLKLSRPRAHKMTPIKQ